MVADNTLMWIGYYRKADIVFISGTLKEGKYLS